MSGRERVYRAWVAAYPRSFREEHGECMVGTLLDGAAQRGALRELRELAALAVGGLHARADHAERSGGGAWRHGVGALLAPLAAVNLAVVAAAFWDVLDAGGVGTWWVLALLAAAGLLAAVAFRRRGMAIAFALAGLIPLGYDEWLQVTGRGDGDHFSIAAQGGFAGPPMSTVWLFLCVVVLVAALGWSAEAAPGRPSHRLAALLGAAIVIAALIPVSLYALLALALVGTIVCAPLGGGDRRLHGIGLALWVVALPYVAAWWASNFPAAPAGWLAVSYVALLPAAGCVAWIGRHRRRRLAI